MFLTTHNTLYTPACHPVAQCFADALANAATARMTLALFSPMGVFSKFSREGAITLVHIGSELSWCQVCVPESGPSRSR